jgi:hypothetical protein
MIFYIANLIYIVQSKKDIEIKKWAETLGLSSHCRRRWSGRRAPALVMDMAMVPLVALMGSLHGKQKNSTVNIKKNQDPIYEETGSNLRRSKQRDVCETNPRRFQSLRD